MFWNKPIGIRRVPLRHPGQYIQQDQVMDWRYRSQPNHLHVLVYSHLQHFNPANFETPDNFNKIKEHSFPFSTMQKGLHNLKRSANNRELAGKIRFEFSGDHCMCTEIGNFRERSDFGWQFKNLCYNTNVWKWVPTTPKIWKHSSKPHDWKCERRKQPNTTHGCFCASVFMRFAFWVRTKSKGMMSMVAVQQALGGVLSECQGSGCSQLGEMILWSWDAGDLWWWGKEMLRGEVLLLGVGQGWLELGEGGALACSATGERCISSHNRSLGNAIPCLTQHCELQDACWYWRRINTRIFMYSDGSTDHRAGFWHRYLLLHPKNLLSKIHKK